MGYHIQYGKTIIKTEHATPIFRSKIKLTLVAILLATTIIGYTAYSYKDALQEYILPGDAVVTASALDALIDNVRAGENLKDSVTAFCLEIMDHADIPQ